MEELAWRYAERGDLLSAERLFNTLASTFSYTNSPAQNGGNTYSRCAHLCRVVLDPMGTPSARRLDDAVEALLERRFTLASFFSNSQKKNASALHAWFLLVHPDKNPNPRSREAFVRLMSFKDELATTGLQSETGLQNDPTVSCSRTPLPPVVNCRRSLREEQRRQGDLDTLLRSLTLKPRVRLNCDLSPPTVVGVGQAETKLGFSETLSSSSDLDELSLTRTVVLEGLTEANCDEATRNAVADALRSRSGTPVKSGTRGRFITHRIVLQRPPTLNEWRVARDQREVLLSNTPTLSAEIADTQKMASCSSPKYPSRQVHDGLQGGLPQIGEAPICPVLKGYPARALGVQQPISKLREFIMPL